MIKRTREKVKSALKTIGLSLSLALLMAPVASANNIESSVAYTGTKELLTDLGKALLLIVPIVTGVLVVLQAMKLQAAEDEGEAKPFKKRIKTILLFGGFAELASTIFTLIMKYYKVTV